MKVKELIDVLKDCREDVEVYFEAGNNISIVKSVLKLLQEQMSFMYGI